MRPSRPRVSIPNGALVPCVVQHADTGRVLMLAYMDSDALEATIETGFGHFHSRSRGQLWKKGETSGNVLAVTALAPDCDGDAILMLALPAGPTCHTGAESCFEGAAPALCDLAGTIAERAASGDGRSYVAGLLADVREARQRKVGEEAVETVLAEPGSDHLVSEVADLWFHSMVLLRGDGRDPLSPLAELGRRRREPAV
ncbi:MAG TPA: bifunctional phosphoribosyl-AMP cyclohydrolase/phosphoribosyl-ATP diphosphatase HisIE [Gaiellales bacterium]